MYFETIPCFCQLPAPPAKGTYLASTASDARSPCPMLNALANHGHLPRNGRNIRVNELITALRVTGLSSTFSTAISHPLFLEQKDPKFRSLQSPASFWARLWHFVCYPFTLIFSVGMRTPGQMNADGEKCFNLDQLARHGVIEHDVSLSRLDHAQGDSHSPQPDLIEGILASSSDGGKTLTLEDLASLRRHRFAQQKKDNPNLRYGAFEHFEACTENALILSVFGSGQQVRCDFVRAFFEDERLPIEEGWKRRVWWTLSFVELAMVRSRVRKALGMTFESVGQGGSHVKID